MACENAENWNNILCRDINELEKSLSENNAENVAEVIDRILVAFEKKCRLRQLKNLMIFLMMIIKFLFYRIMRENRHLI